MARRATPKSGRRRVVTALAIVALVIVATVAVQSYSGADVSRSSIRGARAIAPRSSTSPCGTVRTTTYQHVVWILLENVGWGVVGSPSAPYFNTLASECGLATNDHATTHPSLPNYLALTSGSTWGITDDADPAYHDLTGTSIFSQLSGHWRAYAQSMPSACDRVTSGSYAARHNPAVYYRNLGSTCGRDDTALPSSLNLLAPFTFIAPNICDVMHSCSIATGDAWLAHEVPKILASPQYRAGTLALAITFDENDGDATNRVPLVWVAPTVPHGLRVGVALTHYSLLRATEALLRLPYLRNARTARSLVAPFHL